MFYISDCSILDCDRHAYCMVDENEKIISLPKCEMHKKIIESSRSLYKGFGEVSKSIDHHKIDSMTKEEILADKQKILSKLSLKKRIMLDEANIRLSHTKKLKKKFQDKGHIMYLNSILNNLEDVNRVIKKIKTI